MKFFIIISFFILLGCQLQESASNHGILFLENRTAELNIERSNKNDVVKLLGQPHTKTYNDALVILFLLKIFYQYF